MFGGNSNWRGPIWMPVNALIIRALMHYFAYYGDNIKIECPTGSGNLMNVFEMGAFRDGAWSQIHPQPAWAGNWTSEDFIAFAWAGDNGARHLVVAHRKRHQQ